ncbi:MAG: pectinesterase family protein [Chitinophagaceae bacterium]
MKKIHIRFSVLFSLFLTSLCLVANAQYDVVVAKDGSGNFTTLQAAIDAAPAAQTAAYKIFIKKGKYREKVTIPSTKTFLYFIGESINETIISYDDYAGKAGVTEIATITVNANDCAFMNMTVENSWGRSNDGPQALAIKGNADRLIFKNCRFISGQDTVMSNGNGKRQYFSNCYIDGNTDYVYGSAIAAFDSCIIFSRDRTDGSNFGYLTAANTPGGQTYGYVFRNCLLPDNNGQTTYTLGRPWGNDVQPNTSETKVVFLNCRMGKTIQPVRWSPWSATTNTAVVTYAEYNTKYFNGTNVDLAGRVGWSQEFNAAQAAPYFVNSNLFGTWDPCAVLATACLPMGATLSLSNVRVNRSSTASTVRFNLCWPVNGTTIELLRSTDSLNFATTATSVASLTTVTDTTVSYQFSDALPPSGTSYFYRVRASKTGLENATSDTMLKVNISVPLNNDFRSVGSGGWSNNVSSVSTIAGGAVTGISITSSPAGYTGVPTITFTAAPGGGTTAAGTAIVTAGVVTGVNITTAGAGYTTAPTLSFSVAGVGGNSVWEKYVSSSNSWTPVALGTAPSNTNVTIVSGHNLLLNALAGISSLTIENGASVKSTGTATGATQTLRIGSGTAPVVAVLKNDGLFGSTDGVGDGIILEAFTSCSSLTITGVGTTSISRFRPTAGNVSASPSVLNVVIDQNMTFGYNNVGFTAYYNAAGNTNTETCNLTINAGKTVKMSHASGGIHAGTAITNPQGNITYNINGILDLSATTAVQNFVPHSTVGTASITMNINGLVKLGTGGLNTISTAPGALGSSKIFIKNNGLLDASTSNTINTTTAANGCYFVVEGTGALKRKVAATPIVFPIGTSVTSYNPVTLTNTGAIDSFAVGVKNTFSNPFPNPAIAVSKEWNIVADNAANGSNIAASFGWAIADQGTSFSPTGSLIASRYDGTSWVGTASSAVTGAGTFANPYMTSATGFSAYGNFAVANAEALPVIILSFNAWYENDQIKVWWTTANEINLSSFVVERSVDGINFTGAGSVNATNTTAANNYSFVDANIVATVIYYRLKSIDRDGHYKYSRTVVLNSKLKDRMTIYPNPSTSFITITHSKANTNAVVAVYAADGRQLIVKKLQKGATQTAVDVSALASGNYWLKYDDNGNVSSTKFTRQ